MPWTVATRGVDWSFSTPPSRGNIVLRLASSKVGLRLRNSKNANLSIGQSQTLGIHRARL